VIFVDDTLVVVNIRMKSWVKLFVVAAFIFLWCYLAFSGLVKIPELDILKVCCPVERFQIMT
jgi:hypothetical protein